MNINDWIQQHEANFGSDYERIFVVNVLAKSHAINLNTVDTQFHFKDLDGKNRYCDFVIQEGAIKIAIEVDGYNKRKDGDGQGMSHDDFVDWQRRQAALTASGWHVLRFANRDVCNEPERCQRYIELLLKDQRSKSQHQAKLEEAINHLSQQLKAAQNHTGAAQHASKLQQEINLLTNQLNLAKNTQPLSSNDKKEFQQLLTQLEQENKELIASRDKFAASNMQLNLQKKVLNGENHLMKTTIWAFTAIISVLVMAGAYAFTHSTPQTNTPSAPIATAPANNPPTYKAQEQTAKTTHIPKKNTDVSTPSCSSPIDWRLAKNHVDQLVAVRGTVAEYRFATNSKGKPTWINLGAKYPTKDRLSVVVWEDDRSKFGRALSEKLVSRQICVIGTVKLFNGTPQIAIKWPRDLVFQ